MERRELQSPSGDKNNKEISQPVIPTHVSTNDLTINSLASTKLDAYLEKGKAKELPSGWQEKMNRAKSVIFAATSPIPFHYVTIWRIKLFAFFLIIIFIIYHGIQRNFGSHDSCQWLLRTGRLQGSNFWQPDGCMMHTYTSAQSRVCIRKSEHADRPNSLIFIGDSRLRFLYNQTVLHLTGSAPVFPAGKHSDLVVNVPGINHESTNLSLKFYWNPYLNADMKLRLNEIAAATEKEFPILILVSSGTWTMKSSNDTEKNLRQYKSNLDDLVASLDALGRKSKVLWLLQEPVFEGLLSKERKMLDNSQVTKYNMIADEALRGQHVEVMYANHLVFWCMADSQDGLHLGNDSLHILVQILFNYHCNREMRHRDATCCVAPEPLHSMQIAVLSVLGVFVLIASVLFCRQHGSNIVRNLSLKWKRQAVYSNGLANDFHDKPLTIKDAGRLGKKVKSSYDVFYETSLALAKLGLIMGYFVLCDRTDFFKKENKYYSNVNFFVPLTYIFLVAIFFSENSDQTALLHRDQTDEWKGWMQFVILVYHMTAGSTRLPIYMHVRVLVSSYLFLNGYAHFMYFWNKGDVSAYRFFQIVFRMNLLVFCLCIVPLVTFWFLVTYLTMALPPRITEASATTYPRHNFYMIVKFVVLFAVITTLYLSETFFYDIFLTKPWGPLFLLGDTGKEWFFRWKLDRYSVLEGMVFAFLVSLIRKYGWMNETMSENLFKLRASFAVAGVGFVALLSYLVFALICSAKAQCNDIHSYIVIAPIVGFIFLRNTFGVVRRRFSTLFAWAGRVSLELFIVQFHVWLAADTYGVLVFIPGYPMLNVVFTSFIYLCVAHEVNQVTGVLAEHLVPKDWKYLMLAVTMFGLLLALLSLCYSL